MLSVQIPAMDNCRCPDEVATSPAVKPLLLTKSPLLKDEQTSCTCAGSDVCAQEPCSNAHQAPEVTQAQPQWLQGLFTSELFQACPLHAGMRKNECNYYCLVCTPGSRRGMCKYCLTDHASCGGQVFQIRKYMYQTCVHVEDLHHLYDTSGMQAYCINGKRAVLIHPKVMAPGQLCPVFDNTCRGCEKPLRSDCQYCSLSCKVDVQYGRVPCTPDVPPLERVPRAPATDSVPSSADSDASARSSSSQWTFIGRSKKRKCEAPLRSYMS